jgi:DNA replication licensing factor MCM5
MYVHKIGNYRLGLHRYIYREKLLRMHRRSNNHKSTISSNDMYNNSNGGITAAATTAATNRTVSKLEVDLAHIGEYDAAILGYLLTQPALLLPTLELAAADALDTLLYDLQQQQQQQQQQQASAAAAAAGTAMDADINTTNNNNNTPTRQHSHDIQILLKGNLQPTALRAIKSEHMNRLLQCPGIVISNTPVKHRAVHICIRCSKCNDTYSFSANNNNNNNTGSSSSSSGQAEASGPFSSIRLPLTCRVNLGRDEPCPKFPYMVVPDESRFVDQQTLKLQEAPERVPTGEMPRSVLAAVERSLVDICPPGTRVSVLCIPTLFTQASSGRAEGTKAVYLRVVGLVKETDAHGPAVTFTPAEEEAFSTLAQRADVYDILSRSLAPNISGSYTVDIKKALVCQLLGGSPKRLPDGMRLRGDINVLLLGDPSMAKSQFLKYVSKVAPVGIYTSGKGSSAAGLTASVVRDAKGEFYLEGGAMVLADGGIVCIDEFDKMRPADRVAIHEAMEQQTISVAKAGITTVLNSRSAVLAAANPVFGRYDDFKSASENIDLMTTILSRFDLIFLVRDIREEERDRMICQHVMGVHMGATAAASGMVRGGTGNNPYQAGVGGGGLPGDGPMSGMDGGGYVQIRYVVYERFDKTSIVSILILTFFRSHFCFGFLIYRH